MKISPALTEKNSLHHSWLRHARRVIVSGALMMLGASSAWAQLAVGTLAGVAGSPGSTDSAGGTPTFQGPRNLAVDGAGNIYVADADNHLIRRITPAGVVTTVAGAALTPGATDAPSGPGSAARFNFPSGIVVDGAGANLYVADTFNNAIRKIAINGSGVATAVTTLTGLTGGNLPASGFADGAPGAARFSSPAGITMDSGGTLLYVADTGNNAIRQVTISSGNVLTVAGGNSFAGTAGAIDGTGGAAGTARFNNPQGVAADATYIYVADSNNHAIRRVAIAGSAVSTLAGTLGASGSTDGTGTGALFKNPAAIAVKGANVYVADSGNSTIRQVPINGGATTTLAGAAGSASTVDGVGTAARFTNPLGLAADASSPVNLYVADNQTIRKISATTPPLFTGSGTTQPSSLTVAAGATATFTAVASSNPTATYQWQRNPLGTGSFADVANGGAYSGVTTPTLTIASTTAAMSGDQFRCVATSAAPGTATSAIATLTVTTAPTFTNVASTAFSVGVASSFQLTATASPAPTFAITGGASPTAIGVTLSPNGLLSGTPSSTTGSPYVFTVTATNGSGTALQGFTLTVQAGASITAPPVDQTVSVGLNATFSVVAGGTPASFTYQWYRAAAGSPTSFTSLGAGDTIYTGTQTASLTIVGTTLAMNGDLFRCVVSNGAVSPATSTAALLTVSQLPAFTSAASTSFAVNQASTFRIQATGSPAPTYSITAGTSPTAIGVTLDPTSGLLTGIPTGIGTSPYVFTVTATNLAGSVTQSFTLTVLPVGALPVFTTQPTNQTATISQAATFTVVATGLPAPTYLWQRQAVGTTGFVNLTDSGNYSGSTTASLVVSNVTTGMTGDQFQCIATNTGGSATSTAATLTANVGTIVTTFAGQAGITGSFDATGLAASFNSPSAIAIDSADNVYIADTVNCVIRKITSAGVVSTYAGLAGVPGNTDGPAATARFNGPYGVAVDTAGNVYVADAFNHTIRVISPARNVSTLAGLAGTPGTDDGTGTAARFTYPTGVAVTISGMVFVADSYNHTIRAIAPGGVVTTYAGAAGVRGSADGIANVGGFTGVARFANPNSLAVDRAGNVYVADSFNHTIRVITTLGNVTTLAGLAGTIGSADGTGVAARFNQPSGLVVDSSGNVYVADTFNNAIRKITSAGVVTTIAGLAGSSGTADGTGNAARFTQPYGIALDGSGNIFIADTKNNTIRRSGTIFAPIISTQPQDKGVSPGQNATFTVVAAGSPMPNYQWQRQPVGSTGFVSLVNDTTYSGVTTATLTVTGVTSAMTGDQFQCVVGNFVSPDATTRTVSLSAVLIAPVFTSASQVTFTAGQAGSFTVAATGTPAPTFSATGLPSWATLGATTGVLSGTPPDATGSPFAVTITANNGATATQNFTLTAVVPVTGPVITTQPADLTLSRGQTATFTVAASGTAPLSYQWKLNGAPINGATSATLTLTGVEPAYAGLYTVTVTNPANNTTSSPASLAVNAPPVITVQPRTQAVVAGSTATFGVNASGTPAPAYQWRFNGVPIAGATRATLTVSDAGNYDVIVSNSLGQVFSSLAQLIVSSAASAPVITSQPASPTVLVGGSTSLTVSAYGAPAPTYQWFRNGTLVLGANGPTLLLNNVQASDAGSYTVAVTNSAGSVISLPGKVTMVNRSNAGVYFGTFGASLGTFALYVRSDNTAVFLGYLPGSNLAISNRALGVADTGEFRFTSGTVTIDGAISSGGVITGTLTGVSGATFAGSRAADVGFAQPFTGYYQAAATNTSGTAFAIVGATGQAFVTTQTATLVDGGTGVVDNTGRIGIATTKQSIIATIVPDTSLLSVTAISGSTVTAFSGAGEAVIAAQRLANISTRARVDSGANIAIAGFVISGQDSKPVLIRAIGPTLASFGVTSALAAPKLDLFRAGASTAFATNTGWTTSGNTAAIVAATAQAGAFALSTSSADSVVFTTLPPGGYTAQVSAASGAPGVALIEVYDLSAAAPGQKLFNISTRATAGAGDSTLIAGISVSGSVPKRVLIRAVGPGLVQFGLAGVLAQPQLQLINNGTVVAQNTGISTSPDASAIIAASAQVGAFALPAGSADSALLVSLAPGNYSAVVSGPGGATGIAIIEIYEVP